MKLSTDKTPDKNISDRFEEILLKKDNHLHKFEVLRVLLASFGIQVASKEGCGISSVNFIKLQL